MSEIIVEDEHRSTFAMDQFVKTTIYINVTLIAERWRLCAEELERPSANSKEKNLKKAVERLAESFKNSRYDEVTVNRQISLLELAAVNFFGKDWDDANLSHGIRDGRRKRIVMYVRDQAKALAVLCQSPPQG